MKDSTFEFKDLYLIMTHIHAINHANMKFTIRDILNYPCGLKVIVKIVSKSHFLALFSKQLPLWLLPNYCELFNYPWLTYVKLIIGAKDQSSQIVQNEESTKRYWDSYQEVSTQLSRYLLKMYFSWESLIWDFNLIFNYNFETHQNSIYMCVCVCVYI